MYFWGTLFPTGYKCLAADGRIYISKDVIFSEIRFPFPSLMGESDQTPSDSVDNHNTLTELQSPQHFHTPVASTFCYCFTTSICHFTCSCNTSLINTSSASSSPLPQGDPDLPLIPPDFPALALVHIECTLFLFFCSAKIYYIYRLVPVVLKVHRNRCESCFSRI